MLYLYKSKYGAYYLSKTNEIEIEYSDKKEAIKEIENIDSNKNLL